MQFCKMVHQIVMVIAFKIPWRRAVGSLKNVRLQGNYDKLRLIKVNDLKKEKSPVVLGIVPNVQSRKW